MDLSTIGSINQYAKGVALKTQWNLKKKSGDVTSHTKSLNDFLSVSTSTPKTQQEADNEKLRKISAKVDAGAKLTEKEMEYLKEKNPQLYEKLREIEKEQKAYEEALRHCKSKDEAQRLHMARVGEAMQAAKNGDGTAAYRMNRMTESMTAFAETKEYKSLSTEAEQALERQEQREAEQVEQKPEDAKEETPNRAEKIDGAQHAEEAEQTEQGKIAKETEHAAPTEAAPREEKTADMPEVHAQSKQPASAPVHFGAQAYVSQQASETQEERRRKALDVEA